jgi:putative N-acetylmannosamine-6-phosphate epimerase
MSPLILSIQPAIPFDTPEMILKYVRVAELYDITTVRICGLSNIRYIRENSRAEIIGLVKRGREITPMPWDVSEVLNAGASYVATTRHGVDYKPWAVHDLSEMNLGLDSRAIVTTALMRWTLADLQTLRGRYGTVIAEGGIDSIDMMRDCFEAGATHVCIGTALTDPARIIKKYWGVCEKYS